MKCNYCGAEFEGNFCLECGAKTENETTTPVQEQTKNYQQPMQDTPIKPTKKKKPFYLRWWFIAIVVLVIGSVATSIGNGGKNSKNKGKYEIPNVFGVNYEEAIDILEADGFEVKAVATSVKGIIENTHYPVEYVEQGAVFKIDDYIQDKTGDIRKNDELNYDSNRMKSEDKNLVIYYAKEAYSKDEKVPISEMENETVGDSETNLSPTSNETETGNTQNSAAENEIAETKEEILNISNSSELAAILTTKNEFDPLIEQFANKYMGQKIEFDGYTADVARNGNYKTRFNYLIYVGDYNSSPIIGPQFQIKDVNYYDLHLSGSNVPDTFGVGLNIHIVAEVVSYSENSGLFQIKPVKITIR